MHRGRDYTITHAGKDRHTRTCTHIYIHTDTNTNTIDTAYKYTNFSTFFSTFFSAFRGAVGGLFGHDYLDGPGDPSDTKKYCHLSNGNSSFPWFSLLCIFFFLFFFQFFFYFLTRCVLFYVYDFSFFLIKLGATSIR